MTSTDELTVDGYRVTITYSRTMGFPVSQGTTHTEVAPGIAISVARPEPEYWPETGREPHFRRLYGPPNWRAGDGYEGQFPWPGRHVRHDNVRNNLDQYGAYVFEPASAEEVERFLTPRIARAIEIAHERDVPEIVALQPIEPYAPPQYLVKPVGPAFGHGSEPWYALQEWVYQEGASFCFVDRSVRGWDDHNAIVRYEGAFGDQRDYLATARYLTPAYAPDVAAVAVGGAQ